MRTLYTTDPLEAEKRAQLLREGMSAREFKEQFSTKVAKSKSFAEKMAEYKLSHPTEFQQSTEPPTGIDEILQTVLEERSADDGAEYEPTDRPAWNSERTPDTEGEGDSNDEWNATDAQAESPDTQSPRRSNRRKYAKMSGALADGMTQINLVINGLFVRMVRSDKKQVYSPAMPGESLTCLTRDGYQSLMDEWLDDTPPSPWMLILAGNITCCAFMLLNGESTPKDTGATPVEVKSNGQ